MSKLTATIDGNEAAASVAFRTNEVIAIYPITPASPMGELADQWATENRNNIFGSVPDVVEMQSEGGAAGAVHGSLQLGSLTTTFTASQGLLLMMPNMFKIAGELTSTVFHVAARTLAAQALSIFCDHSDVMATRTTGFALLASNSVQEAMDMALIAQAATLESRVPFLHFFDGFRTSHEISKINLVSNEDISAVLNLDSIYEHRGRAMTPDHPVVRGTAQNPDTFFQAREACNTYYEACPDIVELVMDRFRRQTGRQYHLFQYQGAPDADSVIVITGSAAQTVAETVSYLNGKGEKTGVLIVRLYRPFATDYLIRALPRTVNNLVVLDRTKEPGSAGEPLYTDVVTALHEAGRQHFSRLPDVVGGRYGLSSKEFTPGMVKGIFDNLRAGKLHNHFTVGIEDDVTHLSISYDHDLDVEPSDRVRAVFYGFGSDGTVSANKNSVKIIGEKTDLHVQGYFVYDSRKAGSLTVSHVRIGPEPIEAPYLLQKANFVACHQFQFIERVPVLDYAEKGATFLLNSPYPKEEVWDRLTREIQEGIIRKKLKFFVVDAYRLARDAGLGGRINTIMQMCFFALTSILPVDQARSYIKDYIQKSYGRKGEYLVRLNNEAVDRALDGLHEVTVPDEVTSTTGMRTPVPDHVPDFVKKVTACMIAGKGDLLPVGVFTPDGTFPTGTTKYEKRNIAPEMPVWDPEVCIQCGRCSLVCPHAVIRAKAYPREQLSNAPEGFRSASSRFPQFSSYAFTIQASPEDCTACRLCVEVCPAKNKQEPKYKAVNMEPQPPIREREKQYWQFFERLPYVEREKLDIASVKDVQLLEPLFEFSGACAGCGETPYIKLLTQLYGDRLVIANATGCSSIYSANLPGTPYTSNHEGRGPAWNNSLFEDNAEFGLGMRLALDKQEAYARMLLSRMRDNSVDSALIDKILHAQQNSEAEVEQQRTRIASLREQLTQISDTAAQELLSVVGALVAKSVWLIGGDGWAYDIGYGGLDHVLSLGRDVTILVLDSEIYSNTGGQMSKATPMGAVAKFAVGGKTTPKKDLAMMAMTYGSVYVGKVAMGANYGHTIKTFCEAASYPGTSLVIAYCPCIGQGYDLAYNMEQQKKAVLSGYWPLLRFDPRRTATGQNPLQLDSKPPAIPLEDYVYNETRYRMLTHKNPEEADKLLEMAKREVSRRWKFYEHQASLQY